MFQYRATFVPSTFIIVGCGGTGSRLAPLLVQLVRSLCSKYNPHGWLVNPRVVFIDGDIVEEKNLLRQNFIAKDINQNKAMVLAQRYGRAYGIETHVIPQFLTPEGHIRYYVDGTGVTHDYCQGDHQNDKGIPLSSILQTINGNSDYCVISCVDNMDARRLIVSQLVTWSNTIGSNVLFLDAGNEDTFGQARISTNTILSTGDQFLRKVGRNYSIIEDTSSKLPENLLATFNIPFIPMRVQDYLTNASSAKTGSCADMDQTLQINSMMANMLLGFLQNFMFGNPINFVEMRYDAETGPSATPFSLHELASRDLYSQFKMFSDEEKVFFKSIDWPAIKYTFPDIARQYLAAQNAAWEEELKRLGDIPKLLRGDELPSPAPVAAAPVVVPELQRSVVAAPSTGPIPELVREAPPARVDGESDVAQNRGSAHEEVSGDDDGGSDSDSEGERRLSGHEHFNVEGTETSNNEGGAQALPSEGLRDLMQSVVAREGYLVQDIMNSPVTLNPEIFPLANPVAYAVADGNDSLLSPRTVAGFLRGIRSIRGDRHQLTPAQIDSLIGNTGGAGDVVFNQHGIGLAPPAGHVTNRYLRSGFLPERDRFSFGNPVSADQEQLILDTIRTQLRTCLRILRSYEPSMAVHSTWDTTTGDQENTLQNVFQSFFTEIDVPLQSILPLYRYREISDDFTVSEVFTKLLVDTLNAVRNRDLSLYSRRAFSQALYSIGSWFNAALHDLERGGQNTPPSRVSLLSAESPLILAMRQVAILVSIVEQDRAAAQVESVETAQEPVVEEPTVVRDLTYSERRNLYPQARMAASDRLIEAQRRAEEAASVQMQGFDAVDPNDFQEVEVVQYPIESVPNISELEAIQAPQELVQYQEEVVQDDSRETPVAEVATPSLPLRHTRPRDHLGRFVSFET